MITFRSWLKCLEESILPGFPLRAYPAVDDYITGRNSLEDFFGRILQDAFQVWMNMLLPNSPVDF